MSAYPSQPYSLALEGPSEGRTAGQAYRDLARSQSPQNARLQSSGPNSYGYNNVPYNQPAYNNLSVSTGNAPSDNRYPPGGIPTDKNLPGRDLSAQSLINKMDNILKQSQSPTRGFSSPERKEIPNFSQPNFQNQGIYASPAYSFPLNSSRSQGAGDGSPANFRQGINYENKNLDNQMMRSEPVNFRKNYENPLRDSQSLGGAPRQPEKNSDLFPIQESLRASYLSVSEPRHPENNPYSNHNDMGDLKSRLSNLENQLNALDAQKSNRTDYKDSYIPPQSSSLKNSTYFPANQQPTQNKPTYVEGNYPSYPTTERYVAPTETNPRRDAEISDQIVKKIDDLMNAHIFDSRSPTRTVLSNRNYYTSPSRDIPDSNSNHLYKSSVLPKTEPYHPVTSPVYQSTYNSYAPYDSRSNYDSRPNYHASSSSSYEPLPKYDTGSKPTYDTYAPSGSTYEPSGSTYEPLPRYDTGSKSTYEPYSDYKPVSSYEPRYDYNRETNSTPYSSSYLDRPLYADYEGTRASRPKYIRPLYRNTPEKYRPKTEWASDYVSPYSNDYYYSSIMSTPSRENPDNNSTDKKMKKLTLKSKVSDDRDAEKEPSRHPTIKKPIHHHGTKYPKFRGGDLMSDQEDSYLPLPHLGEEAVPRASKNQRKVRGVNRVNSDQRNTATNFNAGELLEDETTICYSSEEEVIEVPNYTASKPRDNYNAGHLQSDTNYNAGDLLDDDVYESSKPATSQVPANASHRKVKGGAPPQLSKNSINNNSIKKADDFRAGDLQSDTNFNAGDLLDDDEVTNENTRRIKVGRVAPQQSNHRGKKHNAGELLDDGVPVVPKNIVDDGKSWNMPHRLPSSIFEETDGSMFDFDEVERKQSTRPSRYTNTKGSLNQSKPNHGKSNKAVIWALDDPVNGRESRNINNLSNSMKRAERKPVVTHSFEKYNGYGY